MRETKPNLGRMGHLGAPCQGDCAKRTQFGEVKCAKRTQFARSAGAPEAEMRKTNPIPAVGIVGNPHRSSIPSFHRSKPIPIVQNEPNLPPTSGEDHRQGRRP